MYMAILTSLDSRMASDSFDNVWMTNTFSICKLFFTFVKPTIPCFADTYAALLGDATRPWTDAILMIRPQPEKDKIVYINST